MKTSVNLRMNILVWALLKFCEHPDSSADLRKKIRIFKIFSEFKENFKNFKSDTWNSGKNLRLFRYQTLWTSEKKYQQTSEMLCKRYWSFLDLRKVCRTIKQNFFNHQECSVYFNRILWTLGKFWECQLWFKIWGLS